MFWICGALEHCKLTSEAGSFFHLLTKVWFWMGIVGLLGGARDVSKEQGGRVAPHHGVHQFGHSDVQHAARWQVGVVSTGVAKALQGVLVFVLSHLFYCKCAFSDWTAWLLPEVIIQLQFSLCQMWFCMLTYVTVENSESRIMQPRIPSQTSVLTLALTDMTNLNVFRPWRVCWNLSTVGLPGFSVANYDSVKMWVVVLRRVCRVRWGRCWWSFRVSWCM